MGASSTFKLIQELEGFVRQGDGAEARSRLLELKSKRGLTRDEKFTIARLARRAGLPSLSISFLNPLVRGKARSLPEAAPREKAEYAAALIRIGAVKEALELLQTVDPKEVPMARLYVAHGYITCWKYRESIPLLREYVAGCTDPYERIIGEMNLAAALVHEFEHDEARSLSEKLVQECQREKLRTLEGNAWERLAENAIHQKKWLEAEKFLDQGRGGTAKSAGLDAFFILKWTSVLKFLQDPRKYRREIHSLREKARKLSHWETLRECDFFEAVHAQDQELLSRVYFGTPFESYRERLMRLYGGVADVPSEFNLQLGSSAKSFRFLFGEETTKGGRLKLGQLTHRVLAVLFSDYYRPFTIGSLFAGLYPKEYFHPLHSPQRVYQATRGLRRWVQQQSIPLQLKESKSLFSIEPKGKGGIIVVPHPRWWKQNSFDGFPALREFAGEKDFTPQEAAKVLRLPQRTTSHVLKRATEAGVLTRLSTLRPSRYRFSP